MSDLLDIQRTFFDLNPAIEPMVGMMAQLPGASTFIKDLDSRYIFANVHTLSTYDLRCETELIGKRNHDFFPEALAEAYESEDRRVFESGEGIHNEIWLVPHIRGTPRWFISSKSPLLDTSGKVIGLVGCAQRIATPEDQRTHFRELWKAIEFVEKHFVEEITVAKLADIVGISIPHFNRRFRQLLRRSPMDYVLSIRVQEAQRLLATTANSVGDIALTTGFYDQSHFTKRFRKVTGMSPLAYRRRYRG